MRRHAVSCIVFLVVAIAVTSDRIQPTQAFTPSARLPTPADAPLIVRIVDAGMDIIRMPPGPSPSHGPPPAITPGPPQSPPGQMQPAQPRLLKLPVTIGGLASDRQKGWLGVTMDGVGPALAAALGLPSANGVLIVEAAPGGPAGQSGTRFGDIIVAFSGEAVEHMKDLCQRVASAAPGREAVLEVWRVADGNFLQTLTSCIAWAGCTRPAPG
jgi:membrane-associated protease RseP (regulator of RpoE activity)